MNFVVQIKYPLPDLDYFKYELGWDVNSMEDVLESLSQWEEDDWRDILGYPIDRNFYIERTDKE